RDRALERLDPARPGDHAAAARPDAAAATRPRRQGLGRRLVRRGTGASSMLQVIVMHEPLTDETTESAVESTAAESATQWFGADPLWFKRAVFYEIHIRGFADGNADGSGDFIGLTEKLDYLQWLGVDCIWLLPMYPSPLRDGGYDIADFYSIHPDYGTIDDFRTFIDAA